MRTDPSQEGYRERIHINDTVYVVDDTDRSDDALAVRKATVDEASEGKDRLVLILWPTLDSGPLYGSDGRLIYRSPAEVFTEDEVFGLIEHRDPSLLYSSSLVDEILADAIAGREVIPILGGAAIHRLSDSGLEFLNPE